MASLLWTAGRPAEAQGLLPADTPAVLLADEVTYDDRLGVVAAEGHVEVQQAGRLLRADRIVYDRSGGTVAASGNVVLVEPSGDVAFAEYAELQGDLAAGFVEKVSLLLADNSRVIANSGERSADGRTQVDRAVYSPCALCEADPRRAPLWQIRAAQVIHDSAAKDVIYRDAFLDLFGIPVAYTPYFSHPDPSVRQRSGFLTPDFGSSSDLGPFFNSYYYWSISPSQDLTAQLGVTRDEGVLFGTEYRRRFTHGIAAFEATANRNGDDWRGHFDGSAAFDLGRHWRTGADLELVSDDTYLDIFDISNEDVLDSRAYLEGFYGRSYALGEVLGFRDLRPDGIDQPLAVPWLQYQYVGDAPSLLGGHLFADASLLNLEREKGDIDERLPNRGVDTRRMSVEGGWERTLFTDLGVVADLSSSVRGDLYWSDDVPSDGGDPEDEVVAGRIFPRVSAVARYPLVRQAGRFQQLIEPVVGITAAPDVDNSSDIPNNDSLAPEFDEINLFSDDAFPGLDRVEEGVRATYGLRVGLFDAAGGSGTAFFGQSHRFGHVENFPEASGIEDGWSDFVGRVTLTPSPLFNLDWRFRIDDDTLDARRQEVSAIGGPEQFRVRSTYTYVNALDTYAPDDDQEELFVEASSRISPYWTVAASYRRDLEASESRRATFGVTYQDECFTFGADYRRQFTSDREDEEGDSVFFYIALRNLGEFPFAVERADLFGGRDDDDEADGDAPPDK